MTQGRTTQLTDQQRQALRRAFPDSDGWNISFGSTSVTISKGEFTRTIPHQDIDRHLQAIKGGRK